MALVVVVVIVVVVTAMVVTAMVVTVVMVIVAVDAQQWFRAPWYEHPLVGGDGGRDTPPPLWQPMVAMVAGAMLSYVAWGLLGQRPQTPLADACLIAVVGLGRALRCGAWASSRREDVRDRRCWRASGRLARSACWACAGR